MTHNEQHDGLSADEALHSALCALALGELPADDARALEARLATEPTLAAQYDEVRATIALVRTSLGGDEALPAAGLARVLDSARERATAPTPVLQLAWYRRPAVRLAASLVIFAGAGFVGLKALRPAEDGGEHTARVEAPTSGPDSTRELGSVFVGGSIVNGAGTVESLTAAKGVADTHGWTAGEIRKNGAPKYVDPDDAELIRTGGTAGFNPQAVAPEAREALGLRYESGAQVNDAAGVPAFDFVEEVVEEARNSTLYKLQATISVPESNLTLLAVGGASDGIAGQDSMDSFFGRHTEAPVGTTVSPDPGAAGVAGGGAGGAELLTGIRFPLGGIPNVYYAVAVPGGDAEEPANPSAPGPSSGVSPQPTGSVETKPGSLPGEVAKAAGTELVQLYAELDVKNGVGTPLDKASPEVVRSLGSLERGELQALAAKPDGGQSAGAASGPVAGSSAPPTEPSLEQREQKLGGLGYLTEDVSSASVSAAGERDALTDRLRAYRDEAPGANPRLTDEQLHQLVESEWRRIHDDCRRRPNERPRDMYFRFWGDNAFVPTVEDAQSTFGADVDTASYALARRYLREGHAPERAQIRTEEFVNAFTPDLAAPAEDTFGLSVELAPTPFGEDRNHWLVRVGVRGKEVAKADRQPLNLTFVIDTSGSMQEQNRLELVKHAMRLLVTQLEPRDTLAIVAYSSEARQVLAPTSAAHRDLIESAIHPLSPNGSTNADAGLRMGYALAETMLAPNTHNRIVFLSDGVANMGQTDQDRINADVKRFRDRGVYLNTIGVGMNNHNDVFLEQLANKGDGLCDYVDDAKAAEKAIVERFTSAFVPIASDVKLQVEFDPAQVLRWRQLGYENRAIADQDFRNDKVDAGEVGAGHQVTCLYEVELADGLATADAAKALATLRVRWKAPKAALQDPNEVDVFEREATLSFGGRAASFREASAGFRRTAVSAQFAEHLRRSSHTRLDNYGALVAELGALIEASPKTGPMASGPYAAELAELADLVRRADGLGFGHRPAVTDLDRTLDEYRRYQVLRATLEDLRRSDDPLLRQLEDTNRTLEQQIRDTLKRDLQRQRG